MQLRYLEVKHFRSIAELAWEPASSLVCLVGAGDVGKSSVLDAIEAALSPRWMSFADSDFYQCDTTKNIEIRATLGELPQEALQESRMGLHLRGWSEIGLLNDEPAPDDEPVVTVRLTVDATLEPVWELVTDRHEPKTLSSRDRSLFGVVRLGGDVERHLTWGHGSALARLSKEKGKATSLLADAYRKARELVGPGALPWLDEMATKVHEASVELGAYSIAEYSTGLDTQRASMSLGTLALHADAIPVRLTGLGTRRLVALAIERLSIPDGALILIDELEHGLEPHRIRHVLKVLRDALAPKDGGGPVGQAILTTHSSTTVVELRCDQLCVASRDNASLRLIAPAANLQATVRRVPEAFLARRAIVCEGKTEVGLLRGLRDLWTAGHDDEPMEYRGVVLVDGNGTQAPETATALRRLGYDVCLFRDSDQPLSGEHITALHGARVPVIQWSDACATEIRLFRDVAEEFVQRLLEIAYEAKSADSVLGGIATALGVRTALPPKWCDWVTPGKSRAEQREAIGQAAHKAGWFKQIEPGERMGAVVADQIEVELVLGQPPVPLTRTLAEVEAWAYA